jgi:transposase
MRGIDATQTELFTFVSVDSRIPAKHPIRALRSAAALVLTELRTDLDALYPKVGRNAIPPEQVLRAMVIWGLYSLPSERQLLEQIGYNLLFRWFVGLEINDPDWSRAAFRTNRRRLHQAGVVSEFLARLFTRTKRHLLANPHFTVNRSLIDAWLGQTTIRWL